MAADIKLEDSAVLVEEYTDPTKPITGPTKPIDRLILKVRDLELDASDRRKNQKEHRRALVHGPGDTLVINWGPDYPGGVTMDGEVKFLGAVKSHARISITTPPNVLLGNFLEITNEDIKVHTYKSGGLTSPKYDELPIAKKIQQLIDCVKELCNKTGTPIPQDL